MWLLISEQRNIKPTLWKFLWVFKVKSDYRETNTQARTVGNVQGVLQQILDGCGNGVIKNHKNEFIKYHTSYYK